MEPLIAELLKDTPTLALVALVARWVGTRIDRVLALHERMLERLLDLSEQVQTQSTTRS